jgi:hypothetical protein
VTWRDRFSEPRRPGRVIGTRAAEGLVREGIDSGRALSIDNDALRIRPLIEAGWRNACVSYGPFERRAGLAFAVFMLNGHNTAQAEPLPDSFRDRLRAWLFGSSAARVRYRLWRWIRTGRVPRVLRQMRWWLALSRPGAPRLDENLAVGWFPRAVSNPMHEGSSMMMHATGLENGELWARCACGFNAVIRGVQNLPNYYVIVLREHDVAYYAGATAPTVRGLPEYPNIRPVAVGPVPEQAKLWASIHQSVIGQIGFRCDTRVYDAAIAELEDWKGRFGGAQVGDVFHGNGSIDGTSAEIGGRWRTLDGVIWRTPSGAVADDLGTAVIQAPTPTGLLHVTFDMRQGSVGVLWRGIDSANRWEVTCGHGKITLSVLVAGEQEVVAVDDRGVSGPCDLQIVDDGRTMALIGNSRLWFNRRFEDSRFAGGCTVGIALQSTAENGTVIKAFEAQPRELPLPPSLDFGGPWFRTGNKVMVADDFEGPSGPLENHLTSVGARRWSRILGPGNFDLVGARAARVRASKSKPCAGRTLYAVDWDNPNFADLEVTITPPGTAREQREYCLAGFVLWQDKANYITINIWLNDAYPGASVSCFFNIRGWEDVYDAVWSNVGDHIRHGVPCRLRVVFDGMNHIAFVDDVALIFRKLTDIYSDCVPLSINKVGLVANWEWGLDTGSTFEKFRGRA